MPRMNFTKAESAFDKALKKIVIDQLTDLAAIANQIYNPSIQLNHRTLEIIFKRFQSELKKLKKFDPLLYDKLEIIDENLIFSVDYSELTHERWLKIKQIKEKIELLKKDFYGEEIISTENEQQIAKERRRHITKRHNIRDGWLPLR